MKRQHGRLGAGLTVSGVAQTLSVRTVGGDASVEVAQLGAQIGIVEPVDDLIIASEGGGDGQIGVDVEDGGGEILGDTFHREIAEAVEDEHGAKGLLRAAQDEGIGLHLSPTRCADVIAADVVKAKRAVFQILGVFQMHPLAPIALDPKADQPREVFPRVEEPQIALPLQ